MEPRRGVFPAPGSSRDLLLFGAYFERRPLIAEEERGIRNQLSSLASVNAAVLAFSNLCRETIEPTPGRKSGL